MRRIKLVYRPNKSDTEAGNKGIQPAAARRSSVALVDFGGPAVDVYERDTEFVVEVELAGVDEKDIELLLYPARLEIRGVKKEWLPHEKLSFLRMEREFGPFQKEVLIPGEIDPDRACASMDKGVLTVILAKPAARKKRAPKKER